VQTSKAEKLKSLLIEKRSRNILISFFLDKYRKEAVITANVFLSRDRFSCRVMQKTFKKLYLKFSCWTFSIKKQCQNQAGKFSCLDRKHANCWNAFTSKWTKWLYKWQAAAFLVDRFKTIHILLGED